ncbi:aspartate dehydrogenase [Pigmentiphaga soli]|uniref:L-aspartate dehydrogenase n=1 Tax=Pigmentiphaga soli TaxID=1007095 RepID=A0ABP8H6E3_9BURK
MAIAGLGAVGKVIARELDKGIPGLALAAVSARNVARATDFVQQLSHAVPVVALEELAGLADIVVECAPPELLPRIALPVLQAGKKLVVLSVGALLAHPGLRETAIEYGGSILVPTGALIGLDAVAAAAEGTIHSVRMTTRKPLRGLAGAPYLEENGIDVASITTPTRIFSGTAREAARGFPANLNVSVALSLAGIGPDRTMLEVWADPTVTRNTHRIEVDADTASFNMTIENIPSENPKTGLITARSAVALLRKLSAPLKVGT